jgi:hypothetical protein
MAASAPASAPASAAGGSSAATRACSLLPGCCAAGAGAGEEAAAGFAGPGGSMRATVNAFMRLYPQLEAAGALVRLLAEDLKQNWERNRQQLERARQLARRARWWEALDALNRLDHPWWQKQASAERQRVQQGIARLSSKDHEHDSHGSLPHEVPMAQLEAAVQKHLAAGLDEWQAFEKACRELGGKVEEAGPESACRR